MHQQTKIFKYLFILFLVVGLVNCKGNPRPAPNKERAQRDQEIQDLRNKMDSLVEEIENDPDVEERDKDEWRKKVKNTIYTIRQLELEALQEKLSELKDRDEGYKKQEEKAKQGESVRVKLSTKRYNKKLQRWIELFIEFKIKRKH